jgi:CHASE2 domain-containing sensor protein
MSDQQLVKMLGPWKRRHPRAIAIIAIVDGTVLVVIAICLIALGAGGWLRFALLILGAVWAFYGAYRFPRAIRAAQNTHD